MTMSSAFFPSLPGLKPDVARTAMHKTVIKEAISGREYRARHMTSPRYTYRIAFEFLRDANGLDELRPLLGFFNARGGSFDDWLFNDPDDNAVAGQAFGVGDASTVSFQLVRTLGGYAEPVYAVNGAPSIYINGVLKTATTHYTIGATGIVTFATAPGAAAALTWTGNFYWRCRFLQDQAEFAKFMMRLWELKTCTFITVKP